MIGSLADESGERRDGVEGRVAIIVEMGFDAVILCSGSALEFRRFVYLRFNNILIQTNHSFGPVPFRLTIPFPEIFYKFITR